jgi:hypothetical protein
MSYISDCLLKFRALPREWQEEVGGLPAYRRIMALEKKHGVELGFLVVLLTIGELAPEDIEEYVEKKYGLGEEKSREISLDLRNEIFMPAIKKLFSESTTIGVAAGFDIAAEKQNITAIFNKNLVSQLTARAEESRNLNIKIFYVLTEDPDFEEEIIKSLALNAETLTSHALADGSRAVAPSVGNWLTDFIRFNGSGLFDNVALSRYMINSPNAKILNQAEKSLLTKLLVLYRNLKFFPESMAGLPVEEWEIFPLEREKGVRLKARAVSGPPRTAGEKEIEELKQAEENYQPGGIERLALEEEIGEKKQAANLRALAARYKEGSLERKAIEEEIRKLEVS